MSWEGLGEAELPVGWRPAPRSSPTGRLPSGLMLGTQYPAAWVVPWRLAEAGFTSEGVVFTPARGLQDAERPWRPPVSWVAESRVSGVFSSCQPVFARGHLPALPQAERLA